ncbi:hypothetical protein [Rhizobium ruizarguesonis]|uniref:hypothetical protein n=1 Tax=Rhizobium ruizarguesonis TaxID=2081791 RepID=UPI0010301FB4|nr:hypothetical protein [Rhizobium ruizarguesonis]TAW09969.1 hypothetical protein ELI26_10610 [Rhizobium ruizarguesonis]
MDLLINRRGVLLAVPAGLLSSCGLGANTADVSRTVAFESLLRQIKHDIGTYIYRHQNDKSAVGSGKVCAGAVDFIVSKVAITVTAKVDQTTSGSGGLQVPVNLATLDGSVGVSRVLNDTITTKLSIFPLTAAADAEIEDESAKKQRIINPPPAPPDFRGTPIADALDKLRQDLIATSDTAPCFNFGQGEQNDNTVQWAFSVSDKIEGSGKFTLVLFSVGADGSRTKTFANTIDVTFVGTGEGFG